MNQHSQAGFWPSLQTSPWPRALYIDRRRRSEPAWPYWSRKAFRSVKLTHLSRDPYPLINCDGVHFLLRRGPLQALLSTGVPALGRKRRNSGQSIRAKLALCEFQVVENPLDFTQAGKALGFRLGTGYLSCQRAAAWLSPQRLRVYARGQKCQ